MHVLHVMEATIGGTRRHLVDVALAQAAMGLQVTVVVSTLRDPGFPADLKTLERAGVRVERLPMVRSIHPLQDLRHLRTLKRLLKELRPDVVHTHSSKAGVLGRRASLSSGIGVRVHTPHTFAFLFSALFGRAKRTLFRSIEQSLARSTHFVVAVSSSEAETMRTAGVVDPAIIRTVPNGIDPVRMEGAAPMDVSAFGLDPGLPVAVVVGLVYSAKGQDLAIEALSSGRDLGALQILFVGPGDSAPLMARADSLGVAGRIAFTGARDDVPAVLAAADFLLLPSRWEGMPYVVLEAMAASLPVVATPVDGARDLVLDDQTGYLAQQIQADSIADAMGRAVLAGKARREQLGRQGRARLDGAFTVDSMVQGLVSVYGEALGAQGTRR